MKGRIFRGSPKNLGDGVGLTAEDIGDVGRLAALATATSHSNRSEIYVAIATLFRVQGNHLSERERTLMRDILKRLALDVEMAIRISLAERLADDPDAPLELILLLADDTVEVARPILLRSLKLSDHNLIELLASADVERQMVCAARPQIGESVSEKLAESNAEPVLVTLVRNATARIAAGTFETLVEKSRHIAALREPLAHRDDLPGPLANRLCDWVSDALKTYLVDSGRLSQKIATQEVEAAAQTVSGPARNDPRGSGQKLVDKLAIAGQLKPGFLLRVLQQGQTELFDLAFAKLLEIDQTKFCEIFYRKGPRPAALACHAVGIDRCVFPTVFNHSRRSRSINPILSMEDRTEIETVFSSYSRTEALTTLKKLSRG
jgi:uncharacterized protein (DUF2336 family)